MPVLVTVGDAPPLASAVLNAKRFWISGLTYVVFHWAYNVTLPDGVMVEPVAYAVPLPSLAVFQPLNVYPVRVRLLDGIVLATPT